MTEQDAERFEPKPPVSWLFGPDLLVKLRSMLFFALYGSKFDMRDWMEATRFDLSKAGNEKGEFWFDYLADTGDGGRATYAVARLCLADLDADAPLQIGSVLDPVSGATPSGVLPRGQFLIIGGDSAYHVADYATLAERVQKPFRAAAEALGIDASAARRPLFGLPGNHDYYDALDGFARQFRRPLTPESDTGTGDLPPPQLVLHGFERCQTASYFALTLPHGWELWSVDCEIGNVDIRQQHFFRHRPRPEKLIVLTPEPSLVYGRSAQEDDKTAKAFHDLELEPTFMTGGQGPTRLDLSGDIHHYERYFGPKSGNDPAAPVAANYASVVCGLGGAFLHPSLPGLGEIRAQAVYPSPDASRVAIAPRLLNPWRIARGGYVWVFGALVALLLSAAIARFGQATPTLGAAASALRDRVLDAAMDLRLGALPILVVLLPLVIWLVHDSRRQRLAKHRRRSAPSAADSETSAPLATGLVAATVAPGLLLFAGCSIPRAADVAVLTAAGLVVAALVWSVLAILISVRYRERLFRRARQGDVSRADYWPNVVALSAALLAPALALWRFGGTHGAAELGLAILALGVTAFLTLGLVFLAVGVGASGLRTRGKVGLAFLGLHHAATQLAYPQILVGFGNLATIAVVVAGSLLLGALALVLARRGSKLGLLVTWLLSSVLVIGATVLTAPWLDPVPSGTLASAALAALVGLSTSCASLGAYLLVALAFGGHANEAGAAAGIERFKGFIRIKLTQDGLTAYVIGFDRPTDPPRVIDTFSLTNSA